MTSEAWATVAVGSVTLVAQLIFLVVAYALGKSQGRAQTRHEKAAEAIVTGLRLTRRVAIECGSWALYYERDEVELKYRAEILRLRGELQDLVDDNSPWFDPRTEGKLRPVIKDLSRVTRDHIAALKAGDEALARKSGKRLSNWSTEELVQMQINLEDEARRIIGTKRHWTSTPWGKFVAWGTRTTRFFVAYRWVQRKLGQQVGKVIILIGVTLIGSSIYFFATQAPASALVILAFALGIFLGYYLPHAARNSN